VFQSLLNRLIALRIASKRLSSERLGELVSSSKRFQAFSSVFRNFQAIWSTSISGALKRPD